MRDKLQRIKGQKDILEKQLADKEEELQTKHQWYQDAMKAQTLIHKAAKESQEQIRYNIVTPVTTALQTVFGDEFEFEMEFDTSNNNTVCKMYLTKDGEEYSILDSSGYGYADVISFALRVAVWTLTKNRNVLILDEPFKFVSKDYWETTGQMIKEISDKLGIQIIMVTHNDVLADFADKTFIVKKVKDDSVVREIS